MSLHRPRWAGRTPLVGRHGRWRYLAKPSQALSAFRPRFDFGWEGKTHRLYHQRRRRTRQTVDARLARWSKSDVDESQPLVTLTARTQQHKTTYVLARSWWEGWLARVRARQGGSGWSCGWAGRTLRMRSGGGAGRAAVAASGEQQQQQTTKKRNEGRDYPSCRSGRTDPVVSGYISRRRESGSLRLRLRQTCSISCRAFSLSTPSA